MLLTDGSIHLLIQSVSVEHNGLTGIHFSLSLLYLTRSHFLVLRLSLILYILSFSLFCLLRWKSRVLRVFCLLGVCVKYSCFTVCLLVFYVSFLFFVPISERKAFMGPLTICFLVKYLLFVSLSTESNYSTLLFMCPSACLLF